MDFKFKIGQKVLVNPLVSQQFWNEQDPTNSCSFVPTMKKYCGKIVTIVEQFNGGWDNEEKEYYRIIEDGRGHSWRDSSFLPLEKDMKFLNTLLLNGGIDINTYNKVKQQI